MAPATRMTAGLYPTLTAAIVPFLLVYGMSNFFAEFGPNTTTFVLSAELYPVNLRTTGHGLSAGIARVGAVIGVFLFPTLEKALGLSGTLTIIAGFAALGFVLTFRLPGPSGRSLEYVTHEECYRSNGSRAPLHDVTAS